MHAFSITTSGIGIFAAPFSSFSAGLAFPPSFFFLFPFLAFFLRPSSPNIVPNRLIERRRRKINQIKAAWFRKSFEIRKMEELEMDGVRGGGKERGSKEGEFQ